MRRWVFGLVVASAPAWAAPEFRNVLVIPGDATDLMPTKAPGANTNRLGGVFSDLHYDRATDSYLALPDRGPGGGTIAYDTLVQRYKLDVDPANGAMSNLRLTGTVPLTTGGQAFDGLNPGRMGNKAALGRSLDPEGVVAGRDGRFYVSDEYGPSVLEFAPDGALLRTLTAHLAENPPECVDTTAGRLVLRAQAAVLDDQVLDLTPGPLAVLRRLATARGAVLSREDLLPALPGAADVHAVEVTVGRLRTALPDAGLVKTIVKRGYRLDVT